MTKKENSYYGKEDQGKIGFIGCFEISPSEVKQFIELNRKVLIFIILLFKWICSPLCLPNCGN